MKNIVWLSLIVCQCTFAGSYQSLLFHGNCITCHDITTSKSAPSIVQIQRVYQNAFPNQESFIDYMTKWVKNPNIEGSIMHQAIEQYGLMPQLAYDEEVLKEIAQFIYEQDFHTID